MYAWGSNAKPSSPFTGQIHVSADLDIFQWNGTTWLAKKLWAFRQVDAQNIHSRGLPLGSPFVRRGAARITNQWDTSYPKAFVEVEILTTGNIYRQAALSLANLSAWIPTVVPNDGANYTSAFTIRIYEVFDPYLKLGRTNTWNCLYSGMRGRNCYRKGLRRSRFGLPGRGGLPAMFQSSFPGGADLPRTLVDYFFGVMPPALGDAHMSILFTGRGIDLYSQPANNHMVTSLSAAGYKCWNTTLGGWDDAPLGQWTADNGTGKSPAIVWTEYGGMTLNVGEPKSVMKGLYLLKNSVQAVAVYLVRHSSLNKYAFYVKPIGVTHMAFDTDLDPSTWTLVCENLYRGDANPIRRRIVIVEDRRNIENGWRFNIFSAMDPSVGTGAVGGNQRSLDSCFAPKTLQFYVRHNTTGLRSELASTIIEIVKRTNNAAIRFSERRGRY